MGCLSPAWTCFSSSNFQTQMCPNLIFCVQAESIFGLCLDILKVAAPTGLRYGERDYKDPVYGGMLLSVAISPLHPKAPQLAVFKAEGRTSDDASISSSRCSKRCPFSWEGLPQPRHEHHGTDPGSPRLNPKH